MHRAHAAGIAEAKPYGLAPGAPSGHYQRKLERVLGKYNDDMYELSVPGHDKNTLGRCMHKTLAFAAYEQIAEDMAQPTYHTRLLEVIPDLPRVYHEHSVVHGRSALFADRLGHWVLVGRCDNWAAVLIPNLQEEANVRLRLSRMVLALRNPSIYPMAIGGFSQGESP
jgi:hypothetical protein